MGVRPLGAQVLRNGGLSERPLSSWKRSQARRRRAFFYPRPLLGYPAFDLLLVSLLGLVCRALEAPVQRPEQLPNMTGMVANAGHAFDHDRHPRQRPEFRAEAVRSRAFAQGPIDVSQLLRLQPWRPAASARLPQTRAAVLSPSVEPAPHTLSTDREHPSDCRLALPARSEKPGRPLAPGLQSIKVSPRSEDFQHVRAYYTRIRVVTLLCETQ